jgi:arginyl-tRNA synthetase
MTMEGWWVPGRARGWVEHALDDLARELLPDLDPALVAVEPAKAGAKAPFRVDLRRLGKDAPPACERLASALRERDDVVLAEAAPPGVFVLPAIGFLNERLARGVAEHGPYPPRPPEATPPRLAFTFSDPNMNKPLHLGHFRNMVIGMSVTRLLQCQGSPVSIQALHSDWGIHIAQAVLGWLKWGEGATPESTGMKSDHFVGSWYARFHQEKARQQEAAGDEEALTDVEREAFALLQRMQDGDQEAIEANTRITDWVEAGVAVTYERTDCTFDHIWRERRTTHLGVQAVHDGLAAGVCKQRDDTSIYLDLSDRGLGEVTLLRSDGTPVVYTQWYGVDLARYPGRPYDHILQMSGQEWAPGETVYTEVARDLGGDWVEKWTHFYYGMVTLTGGKMSSRAAGSTVLVDDLLDDLVAWFGNKGDGERAAAALTRFHFLAPKRLKDVVYDHETLVGETLPTLRRVLVALAAAEEGAYGSEPADTETAQALLLRLNGFPRMAQTAAQRLEPEYVVTYLVELAGDLDACLRKGGVTAGVARAAAVTIRAAFQLLNVDPDRLRDLPPVLLDD